MWISGAEPKGQFFSGDCGKELPIHCHLGTNTLNNLPKKACKSLNCWKDGRHGQKQHDGGGHQSTSHLSDKNISHEGFEHLHLRGLRKPSPYNASLLHQVALLLWHALLSFWHPGRNRFNSNSAPSLMASIISCQFNMLLPSCRVAQWCWHPLATQPPRYP